MYPSRLLSPIRHALSSSPVPRPSLSHIASVKRALSKPPVVHLQRHYSKSRADSDDEDLERIQDEGEYEIVLPRYTAEDVASMKRLPIYTAIPRPPYATPQAIRRFQETGQYDEEWERDGRISSSSTDFECLEGAGYFAASILDFAKCLIRDKEVKTTNALDRTLHQFMESQGLYPSPLEYKGFPKSICTSVNNIVAHGIPDDRPLVQGDIINVDVTVYTNGFHGDTSRTFIYGEADRIGKNLVDITEQALNAAIAACGPGKHFRDIGRAIHNVINDERILSVGERYVVCPAFTGHGIGKVFHRPPWIFHDVNDEPGIMLPGHCFTIEPCIIVGNDPDIHIFPDGWTASTTSLARSAQAEDMIYITESGVKVLTRLPLGPRTGL